VLSRFGLCTVSSGIVNATLDVGIQRPVDNKILAKTTLLNKKFETGTSQQLVSSVDQVIAAYLRVKSKMHKVRETMRSSLDRQTE
jgi:hypothetical protein